MEQENNEEVRILRDRLNDKISTENFSLIFVISNLDFFFAGFKQSAENGDGEEAEAADGSDENANSTEQVVISNISGQFLPSSFAYSFIYVKETKTRRRPSP